MGVPPFRDGVTTSVGTGEREGCSLRSMSRIFPLVVAGAVAACGVGGADSEARADLSLFYYEPVPFEFVETPSGASRGQFASANIVFQGPTRPITGRLHRPAIADGDSGVLLLHGSGGSATDMDDVAAALACSGATALAINAPNAQRGDGFVRFTEEDYDEQVHLIQNLRRSTDWLVEEQGVERLGFVGVSYGAAMGSLLVGVEPRIDAAALMVGDGGLVAHFTEGNEPIPEIADIPDIEEWIDRMTPIEPSLFMANAGDTPIRLVSARNDEAIPETDALAWHEAAGAGADVVWADTGHSMSVEVWTETVVWLSDHLNLDGHRIPECDGFLR